MSWPSLGSSTRRTSTPTERLADDEDHRRRRDVRLTARPDGSGDLSGCLTPAALAALQAVLDPLAAPKPATDGTRDERTAGQRMHDGLEQLATRTGLATTGHGGQISIPESLRLAAEAEIIPTVLNEAGGVRAYGRTR